MFGRFWFGHGPRSERLFERGDLKYLVLDLLKDKPSHGYEIMRALGERFGGFYTPSPGAVYPTLQMLEDLGYVTSVEKDGKRVYSITDLGRKFLDETGSTVDDIWGRASCWSGPEAGAELHAIGHEMHELRDAFRDAVRHYGKGKLTDPAKLRRIHEVIARARLEIEGILSETSR